MLRRRTNITYKEFDKTQFVENELIDKVSLWIYRILFRLGGLKEFVDKNNYFRNDELAYFLDVGEYVDMDSAEFDRKSVVDVLRSNYIKLENKRDFGGSKVLQSNIKKISKLINLSDTEIKVLEFSILLRQYDILGDAAYLLGNNLNTPQTKRAISAILDISHKKVDEALSASSKLVKSGLLFIDKRGTSSLNSKIEIISDNFADDMLSHNKDVVSLLKEIIRPCFNAKLSLKDYAHIKKDINIIISYLKNSIEKKQKGVNILLYGPAGTGKTELAKTIAKVLGLELFEISYADEDDEAMGISARLKALKVSNALFANRNALLLYDEAEDVFDSREDMFISRKQDGKAWLNKMLESNTVATIWITNYINRVDNAIIRRFDYALEMSFPPKKQRKKIIKNYSNNMLDEKTIKLLSKHNHIAPAIISKAAKVVKTTDKKKKDKMFVNIINNTLKAQGYIEIKSKKKNKKKDKTFLPSFYNPAFLNTNIDLEELAKGIKKNPNARLCLYGPAGTGKSAYAKYIAKKLNKPFVIKKGSDLLSMWVGGSEKNIANAFEEAKNKKAVLVFDEVDSFLQDRKEAKNSWEISQVNEMLTQMESFDGIFIATTNLMDNLDKASIRRFDLKLKFDYLKPEQTLKLFKEFAKDIGIKEINKDEEDIIKRLRNVVPGDLAAIKRQSKFNPVRDAKDLIERVKKEINLKNNNQQPTIGFLG